MATIVPGVGADIAKIGEAISDFIDPNRELKSTMRQLLATNPELTQKIADLEHDNPGTLKELGLSGSVEKTIKQVKPSFQNQLNKILEPHMLAAAQDEDNARIAATKAITGLLPSQTAAESSNETINKELNKFLKENPEAASQIAKLPHVRAQLETAQASNEARKIQREKSVIESSTYTPQDINLVADARDFYAGKLAPDKSAFYNAYTPALKTAWDQALQAEQFRLETNFRRDLANIKENPRETLDKFWMTQSLMRYRQTNLGSPEAWYSYFTGGSKMPGSDITATFEDVQAVAEADRKLSVIEQGSQTNTLDDNFNSLRIRFESAQKQGASESEKSQIASEMNRILRIRAAAGEKVPTAVYVEKKSGLFGWFSNMFTKDSGKLIFINEDGSVTNSDGKTVQQDSTQVQNTTNIKSLADRIINDPRAVDSTKRRIALDNIKTTFPQYYEAVKSLVDSTFNAADIPAVEEDTEE